MMALSRPLKEDRHEALPLSTPLSDLQVIDGVMSLALYPRVMCLKLLNTSDLPRRNPPVMVASFFPPPVYLLCRFL